MFEATVSCDGGDSYNIDYIAQKLSSFKSGEKTIAEVVKGNRKYLCVGCSSLYEPLLKDLLLEGVSDVLALGYKNKFFTKRLEKKDSLLNRTLINVMCLFDNVKDKRAVLGQIEQVENISLDGIFNFRVRELKERWEEVLDLTNAYGVIASDDFITTEFLCYLIDSIPPQYAAITATVLEDSFILQESKGKKISPAPLITKSSTKEERLLYNLVCNKAKSVVVLDNQKLLSETCISLLDKLFNAKMQVKNH